MITLNTPDGRVVADVTNQISDLMNWMLTQTDRPKFHYSQGKYLGALTLKRECDLIRVCDFLQGSDEIDS